MKTGVIQQKIYTPKKKKQKKKASYIILYFFLIFLALICFSPFYLMIINCTHNDGEILSKIWLTPGTSLSKNYQNLVNAVPIWAGFFNSLFLAVSVTILSGYFSALTAFGFSKYHFKGNKVFYYIVLGSMMIPSQLGITGFYQLAVQLHLLNSYIPLILPSIANAWAVFFIKGYIDDAVHSSLMEAARLDGCSEFLIFNLIALPLIMPAIATISIFTFIGAWNSYLMPLIILSDINTYTMPVLMVIVKGAHGSPAVVYTALAISTVPIMIVFSFMSKKIVGGLSLGGVKG